MKNTDWGKIGYWTLCTLLVLSIFFLFFGIVPMFFLNDGSRDLVKLFASIFSVIGLLIMVMAVHKPGLAWKRFLAQPEENSEPDRGNQIALFGLGACFVIGSLLYAFTGNISAVIGLFFIFTVVMGILKK